jgi:hypothetical protein
LKGWAAVLVVKPCPVAAAIAWLLRRTSASEWQSRGAWLVNPDVNNPEQNPRILHESFRIVVNDEIENRKARKMQAFVVGAAGIEPATSPV